MFQIIGYIFGLVTLKGLKKLLILPIGIFATGTVFSFYFFVISTLLKLYELVQTFINTNIYSNQILTYMFGFMNAIGVIDGLNAGLPLLFSSITFLLMYILFKHTIELVKAIFFIAKTFTE